MVVDESKGLAVGYRVVSIYACGVAMVFFFFLFPVSWLCGVKFGGAVKKKVTLYFVFAR